MPQYAVAWSQWSLKGITRYVQSPTMPTRKALHAGSWYSGSGAVLSSELDKWLKGAEYLHGPARAVIAPHAGYSYCGACGGFAYRQIDPTNIERVFILGPSHHVYLPGCALSAASHYETPLYNLPIDQTVYHELYSTGQFEEMSQNVDEQEHSIEMQLPYVAKVMEPQKGKFTIVPVLVGALKEERELEYGKVFSKYLADQKNLFVISSDFCHWGKRFRYVPHDKAAGPIHASIEALDREGMARIESLEPDAFSTYIKKTQNTICGRHPIAVLMQAVQYLKACCSDLECNLRFVQYAQSSRCTLPSDSSVSYASAALTLAQK